MAKTVKADVCVLGAGPAGLSFAAGAAQMGATVVLVEKGEMGGDCLNFGCVPSKALLAAAKRAAMAGTRLGVTWADAEVDFAAVNDHVRAAIAGIAPHDSQERFERLGVTVLREEARFLSRREVAAGDHRVRARRFVIATGSRPMIPSIPGLEEGSYLTNESLFDLRACPEHLIIIGAGTIGMEMAQAHRRLGAAVTLIESDRVLCREDPDAVQIVLRALGRDGVRLLDRAEVTGVRAIPGGVEVAVRSAGREDRISGSHLLIAAGRRPNVETLGLEAAGVAFGRQGIAVDARLRTTNKRIYALGDVTGRHAFTHMAGYDAGIAIRNILFRLPAKARPAAVPRVTYTDPELAQLGLTEREARQQHKDIRVLTHPFGDVDRSRCAGEAEGFLKAMVKKNGRILGVTCVGKEAGDLIQPWGAAIQAGLSIKHMANQIVPYPTRGDISKRVAGLFYQDVLFGPKTRLLVRFLQRWP